MPTNVPTVPTDDEQKPPISSQVSVMLQDVEDRAYATTRKHIDQEKYDLELRMRHNNDDLGRKLQEVSDKIDVVLRAVFNHGSQD